MISTLLSLVITLQQPPLTLGETVKMENSGRFDYMAVDDRYRRVYASHPAAKTLAVLDLKSGKAWEIDTQVAVNGVQLDLPLNKLFVTGGGQRLLELDLKTLKLDNLAALVGPGDDLAIDESRQEIYVCNDDGDHLWVFNAKTLDQVATVKIPEAPEYIEYDPGTDKLYQNIKSNDTIQVIDPTSKSAVKQWMTGPENKPHGLALDRKTGRAFSAGSNGKLDVFDLKTGTLLATLDIAPKTDQIAFDSDLKRVYCTGDKALTVVQETPAGATVLATVPAPEGAHTIAVDPRTHDVWICYSGPGGAFFQSYHAH